MNTPPKVDAQPESKVIEMDIKCVALTTLSILLSIGVARAADQPEQAEPMSAVGFGSSTGIGIGGSAGSASSVAGGFGSATDASGTGSPTFGSGFDQQPSSGNSGASK